MNFHIIKFRTNCSWRFWLISTLEIPNFEWFFYHTFPRGTRWRWWRHSTTPFVTPTMKRSSLITIKTGARESPGGNVIKLFLSKIYEFP